MNSVLLPQRLTLAKLVGKDGLFVDGDWVESKDQDPTGDVRLIQLADVGDAVYVNKSSRFLTSSKAHELKCTFLQAGDILVARMPDPIGRACIFPGDDRSYVTVVDVCVVRPGDSVDRRWLMRAINSPAFRAQIEQHIKGTTRQRISRTNLGTIEITVPPLSEQRRIADILDKADAICRKRKEAIALTEELLRSAFLEIFGDPVTNPKGWEVKPLGDLAEIASGVTKGKKYDGQKMVTLPYMRVANVQDGHLVLDEVKTITVSEEDGRRYQLRYGDVLLTEGGDPDKLGRGAVWRSEVPDCIHQNHIFRVRPSSKVKAEFLSAIIGSERGKSYFLRAAKQTTGIATINMTQLKAFPALVPPMQLQERYVSLIAHIHAIREKQRQKCGFVEDLFGSLVRRAFSGTLSE